MMYKGEIMNIQLDTKLGDIKEELIEMGGLVENQLKKTFQSFMNQDKDLAREVILNERRVNAYELKIDRDCEYILALSNPIAADLRVVLAVLKINYNLERIGDIAYGIAKFIVENEQTFQKSLLDATQIVDMFSHAEAMLTKVIKALDSEDSAAARSILTEDDFLDSINRSVHHTTSDLIKQDITQVEQALHVYSMIRKLERVGDQVTNIAEEIIFYIEAKVLKHKSVL